MGSKNLIAILKTGSVPYANFTEPRIFEYAEKCGADVLIIDKPDVKYGDHIYANKFQSLYRFCKNPAYSKLLYIDLDILISPFAPNIFEVFGPGFWAAPAFAGGLKAKYVKALKGYLGFIPEDLDFSNYCNGGVWLFDRNSATCLLPHLEPPFFCDTANDQGTVHWACYQAGIAPKTLPQGWNCPTWRLKKVKAPHFLHFAGKAKLNDGGIHELFLKACKRYPEIDNWDYSFQGSTCADIT